MSKRRHPKKKRLVCQSAPHTSLSLSNRRNTLLRMGVGRLNALLFRENGKKFFLKTSVSSTTFLQFSATNSSEDFFGNQVFQEDFFANYIVAIKWKPVYNDRFFRALFCSFQLHIKSRFF